MSRKRPSLKSPRTKSFVLQRGLCYYCGLPMWNHQPDELAGLYGIKKSALRILRCTGEHLIPFSDGGSASVDNIVAACEYCNKHRHYTKRIRTSEQFRAYVSRRVNKGKWHTNAFPKELLALAGAINN